MSEEAESADEGPPGAPAWMTTFADLSTLLLCFFVLLLSFSEMDVAKFKQLAGSMRQAFGVQAEIKVKQIPKGTSIVAKEFSPGEPKPTALNQVRQFTIDSTKNTLRFSDPADIDAWKEAKEKEEQRKQKAEESVKRIAEALSEEIKQGKVLVRAVGEQTIIHIQERGSFLLGSASIKRDFLPVLKKINDQLRKTSGIVRVAGHTDNLPISTGRFRSNWDLSTARAASVLHGIMGSGGLDASRFIAAGHADTVPLASNATREGRARNRRVDISIYQGDKSYFIHDEDFMLDQTRSPQGAPGESPATATQTKLDETP
ncbi:MAG: MotB family protein [Pseudomonadota bacterium]